jgi:hypothetical protein
VRHESSCARGVKPARTPAWPAEQFSTLKPPGGELHAGRQRRLQMFVNIRHGTSGLGQHSGADRGLLGKDSDGLGNLKLACRVRAAGGADAVPAGAETGRPVPGRTAGRREPSGLRVQSLPTCLNACWPGHRVGCRCCALRTPCAGQTQPVSLHAEQLSPASAGAAHRVRAGRAGARERRVASHLATGPGLVTTAQQSSACLQPVHGLHSTVAAQMCECLASRLPPKSRYSTHQQLSTASSLVCCRCGMPATC